MKTNEIRYVHEEEVHNFKAAREVVPFIIEILNPKSVVDVGCGIGTWLKVFEENGIIDVLGIDGNYVDKSLMKIDLNNFIDFDLEKLFISDKKFDLAISLEVAEHLSEASSDVFVKTLTGLSDVVIFSAAIPLQDGQNHINEQEPQYWIEKFEKEGYKLLDIIRPFFWNNKSVDWWYRQNILLFTNKKEFHEKFSSFESYSGSYIVHPESFYHHYIHKFKYFKNRFETLQNDFEKLQSGKYGFRFYLNLLKKTVLNKFYS